MTTLSPLSSNATSGETIEVDIVDWVVLALPAWNRTREPDIPPTVRPGTDKLVLFGHHVQLIQHDGGVPAPSAWLPRRPAALRHPALNQKEKPAGNGASPGRIVSFKRLSVRLVSRRALGCRVDDYSSAYAQQYPRTSVWSPNFRAVNCLFFVGL
jgi:hypothetical protein